MKFNECVVFEAKKSNRYCWVIYIYQWIQKKPDRCIESMCVAHSKRFIFFFQIKSLELVSVRSRWLLERNKNQSKEDRNNNKPKEEQRYSKKLNWTLILLSLISVAVIDINISENVWWKELEINKNLKKT